ncbi:hypothetical protein PCANC_09941 [Puccinia coronata f. sp. avenae]|uniref:Uncharacterized protein n=1 Tax=Puccinia coronata f. sp. avenae TaxID=200324 RepID=A0A2N5V2S1_9BASI|nr:hypothetical protein PCANC_09941 [Puccinia coronata f. sp. avenae]
MSSELDQLIQHSHQITIQLHNTLQQIPSTTTHELPPAASHIPFKPSYSSSLASTNSSEHPGSAHPANTHQLIQPKDNDNDDDQQDGVTTTLLQRLEAHFQAIYHHRQIQRDAANIVRGVTSSTTSAPPPANPSSSIIMSSQKNITVTPAV